MYDEGNISAEFRALAAQADEEFRAMRGAEAAGALAHDEVLARSCVYGYLYERYFLESPALLLNELRWLQRSGRPQAPKHARSAERFTQVRDQLLAGLVSRFEKLAGD